MAITRESTMPFGKHKGEKIKDIPKGYLEWATDGGLDRSKSGDIVSAFERELAIRNADEESRGPRPTKSEHAELAGKAMLDNIVVAFDYIALALKALGYDMETSASVEAVQKMATTVAIHATDRGLDLRGEVGKLLSKMREETKEPLPF